MGKGRECSINKRCFDITMSRRTRKSPFNHNVEGGISIPAPASAPAPAPAPALALKSFRDGNGDGEDQSSPLPSPSKENDKEGSTGRSSLGQHFTEEGNRKHLQLVKKQQKAEESLQGGVKLKKLVSRCAKVLGHLVKVRSDPTLREPRKLKAAVPRITM
ncbi:hypothetical protein ACFX2C_039697 [Malus domestica]